MRVSLRVKGVIIATIGVLLVTPDAVLIRTATHLGAPRIMVVFWKLAFNFGIGSLIVVVMEAINGHSVRDTVRRACEGGQYMLLAIFLQALIGVSFPMSFLLTFAANALLCVSLSPIWSAFLGWFLLKDDLPSRTIGALVASAAAIAIMFVPRMFEGDSTSGDARRHVGNAVAFLTGLLLAAFLIVARMAGMRQPDTPIQVGSIVGAGVAACVVGVAAVCSNQPVFDPAISPLFFVAMALDGFGLASIFVAFSIAPRYVSSAQVALISLLETVLGPTWCFLVYGERPPDSTLLGGALLLVAVFFHEYFAIEDRGPVVNQQHILLKNRTVANGIKYEALETQKEVASTGDSALAPSKSPALDSKKAYLPF